MSFLAPLYLLVGAAASVPLLLHLLRRNVSARVEFPAARYLQRAEQDHSRSMRIRNLLLMLLRVLLILALALAAARPFVSGIGVGHAPTALAIVLDNSLSTTAVVGGTPTFNILRDAARALAASTTAADKTWLVTADGRVRGGTREAIIADIDKVVPSEDAGDLPLAIRRAAAAVKGSPLQARSVAVATDGQASAWTAATRIDAPVAIFTPAAKAPVNRSIATFSADPQRFTPRGSINSRIEAADSANYRILIGARTLGRGAVARGEPVQLRVAPPERGWQALTLELEPDDFVADDVRHAAVWIGPPPAVLADATAGPFVSTALTSLIADGRATAGATVRLASADAVSALPALLMPPADPVRIGAANRALERLRIPWRFAAIESSPALARGARLDGIAVTSRYHLRREGAAPSDTIATAGSEPWIVSGPGYVLVSSRLDPAATTLPVRAAFVPWLADMIDLRLGGPSGEVGAPILTRPGARLQLPPGIDAWENSAGTRRSVSGTDVLAPAERGVWFLLRGAKRVGAVVVNAPPGESQLARTSGELLAQRVSGKGARAATSTSRWASDALAAGSRRPALFPLLVIALLLLAAEGIAVRTSRSAA